MNIFSIKNEKLNFFNRPIYCESEKEALSYIQNVLMSDADRALIHLKDDLSLYKLGEINFETGEIFACDFPVFITGLSDIFDTIPEDRVPRFEKDYANEIKNLKGILSDLENLPTLFAQLEAKFNEINVKGKKK